MTITGGQALVEQLVREGVQDLFGIPGIQLDWAVDALRQRQDDIRLYVPRHEQTTSYMADGYARSGTREGVCMTVPGPGMLNALSGLATGYACSSRMLFVSGQIESSAIGKGYGLLHEIPDQSGILASLTKWHALARCQQEVADVVHEAFVQLRSGHPRPVAIEIPPDVLQGTAEVRFHDAATPAPLRPAPARIAQIAALLRDARSPVIVAGGGVAAARAGDALRSLAERLQAPVVMTENARGVLSSRHDLATTMLGSRALLPHADVVLVVGSRFLDALGRPHATPPGCRIVYVNLDPRALGAPRPEGVALEADAGAVLAALAEALQDVPQRPSRAADMALVRTWCDAQLGRIRPQADHLAALRSAAADDDVLVSELTQVGYYAGLAYPAYQAGTILTPGYQGTLGYGFPTALGACVANPEKRVISISGDGGFGWGASELATVARYGFDLSIVVFVDGQYGNVRRIQRQTFGSPFATDLTNPDFQILAQAYGIPAEQVVAPEDLEAALKRAAARGGPSLIEVRVGEMPSPWALIHAFVPPSEPPPPLPILSDR
ncbi:thiamine pyrophosphate-dependent enzyme [Sphingomonas sp. MMS12-HWE2-04]|uniref:thiamine pyrophosphate-dependent enzyme n=1 Tax=Sphingomonas sp. MMS12-HWE2-04 TaxID=3234199 RepID=UPI00385067AE